MSEQKPLLPPALHNVYLRARTWLGALSRPARILWGSTAVLALAFAGLLSFRATHESYAVLFSQLDRDDAGALVAKLKELKIPYRVGADGGTIEVPEDKVHELRLDLASAGLPRGGGVGFESFDKLRLGSTEFEQRVLYRRALEGELSRTIGTLSAVQSARVHLVLPEKSVFVAHAEPASASLVVRLRPGRMLGGSEVAGIVHLAASSVPALTPDRITLVTTEGQMLHRPRVSAGGGDEGAGATNGNGDPERESQARTMEVSLEERARAMLEKVVGAGHVDVRVSADMDYARVERVEDRYDAAHSALRSEESTIDRGGQAGVDDTVAGVPGAESNLPASDADGGASRPAAATAGMGKAVDRPTHEAHTRNYEIDHVTERRIATQGSLRRLTVAVVLDGTVMHDASGAHLVPRPKEEVDRVAMLVRSAVGANDTRGDLVTVESIPFLDSEVTEVAAPAPPAPNPIVTYVGTPRGKKVAMGVGAGAVLLFFIMLLKGRRAAKRRAAEAEKVAMEAALLAPPAPPRDAPVAELVAGSKKEDPAALEPADLHGAVRARAANDPATAALVVRYWLGTGDDSKSAQV